MTVTELHDALSEYLKGIDQHPAQLFDGLCRLYSEVDKGDMARYERIRSHVREGRLQEALREWNRTHYTRQQIINDECVTTYE